MVPTGRRRDPTFLRLALFAAAGGAGAIAFSIAATVVAYRAGHRAPTFLFFSLWGIAALAGAAANVVVYFQSGDPPPKPPRGGGATVTPIRRIDARRAPPLADREREAA